MALTPLQANDQYIIDSVAQFLSRNVKTQYDALVATSPYNNSTLNISQTLKIMQGKPSDSSIGLAPPSIGIEDLNAGAAYVPMEVGTLTGWRGMNLILYCFPAVNSINGEPSDIAANLLKGFLRSVLSTPTFQIIDYSNASCTPTNIIYTTSNAWIDKFSSPLNRLKSSPNALERNRFDITVSLSYPVAEQRYL